MSQIIINTNNTNYKLYEDVKDENDFFSKFESINELIVYFENANQLWVERNLKIANDIVMIITKEGAKGKLTRAQVLSIANLAHTKFLLAPVIIQFSDDEKIQCNKFLLLSSSKYFRTMLMSEMHESQTNTIKMHCDQNILSFVKILFKNFENINLAQLDTELNKIITQHVDKQKNHEVLTIIEDLYQRSIHEWNLPDLQKMLQLKLGEYVRTLQEHDFVEACAAAFNLQDKNLIDALLANATSYFDGKVQLCRYELGGTRYFIAIDENINSETLLELQQIISCFPQNARINMHIETMTLEIEKDKKIEIKAADESATDKRTLDLVMQVLSFFPDIPVAMHTHDINTLFALSDALQNLKELKLSVIPSKDAMENVLTNFPIKRLEINLQKNALTDKIFLEKSALESLNITSPYISISHFPPSLKEIQLFGICEELPLYFPQFLKKLELGVEELEALPELPLDLETLKLNGKIKNLFAFPQNLKALELQDCKVEALTGLPENLESLTIVNSKLKTLTNLPNNLKILHLDGCRIDSLSDFPENLESLTIVNFKLKILTNLPSNLKTLNLESCYMDYLDSLSDLPEGLESFTIEYKD